MENKTIIITGASDGIGKAAAEKLCRLKHNVIIVGRNEEKTQKVAEKLNVPFYTADYADLSSVVRLAQNLKKLEKIDVLCHNAGGAQGDRQVTKDGVEKTFQINVLGGFLLTRLLTEKLIQSRATVISTSSIAANLFGADFDGKDFQNEKDYSPFKAYGYAKLEDALFTYELNRKYKEKGISAVAFEPGVVRTNFASESKGFIKFCYHSPLKYLFTITPKRSAERLVWLATGTPEKDFVCGKVYTKHKIMQLKYQDETGETAKSLWQYCEGLTDKYL